MIYIDPDNKIIVKYLFGERQEVINNTGYLPLCVRDNIILMSDGELYSVPYSNYKLSKINFGHNCHCYVVESADFTDRFVKIDFEYYEIFNKSCKLQMRKIPIVAKNCHNIIKIWTNKYIYVDIDNKLVFFYNSFESCVVLDYDVDSIHYHCCDYDSIKIVYTKKNKIICCEYKYSHPTQTYTYDVDYNGSTIIKSSDWFALDSDNKLYRSEFVQNKYTITKILDCVVDFVLCDFTLYISDSEHKIYEFNSKCNNYICDGHFGKKMCNVKSAKKILET